MSDLTLTESKRLLARNGSTSNRPYLKAAAILFLAVLAGWVIGVAGTVLYFKKNMHRVPPRPDAIASAMLDRMHSMFALDSGEDQKLKAIINTHMSEIDAMRKDTFRDIRNVAKRMDGEIATVLGPDRYKIWEADKKARSAERRRQHEENARGSRDDDHPGRSRKAGHDEARDDGDRKKSGQ